MTIETAGCFGRSDTFSNAIDDRLQGSIAARSFSTTGLDFASFHNEWTLCHVSHMLACHRLGQIRD